MSGQNTLITCALDAEVVRPGGTIKMRQFYRDKSVQGLGVYKAMDENGAIEIIGGPGVGNVGSQLSVEVTYNSGTRTLTAIPAGGTPATYAWTIKSFTSIVGQEDATYNGATNASTAVITAPGLTNDVIGLATVKVTDTLGRIAYGSYLVMLTHTIA